MRLLMIGPVLPTVRGPMPRIVHLMAEALRGAGWTVELEHWGQHAGGESLPGKLVGRARDVRHLARRLADPTVDLVLVHSAHDLRALLREVPLVLAASRAQVPMVYMFHGTPHRARNTPADRAWRWLFGWLVRRMAGVLVLSRAEQAMLECWYPGVRVWATRYPFRAPRRRRPPEPVLTTATPSPSPAPAPPAAPACTPSSPAADVPAADSSAACSSAARPPGADSPAVDAPTACSSAACAPATRAPAAPLGAAPAPAPSLPVGAATASLATADNPASATPPSPKALSTAPSLGTPATGPSVEASGRLLEVPTIAFVGRAIIDKGLLELVRSLPRVLAHTPARLVVCGDGPALAQARMIAHQTGISQAVEFLGWQSPADVQHVLERAAVLVLPSVREGFPSVVLEAMAAGLPIITTPVGGIPDHLHEGTHALFVPPGDVPALAARIITLLDDPTLRARLGAANLACVQTFAPERVVADYLAILRPLARGSRPFPGGVRPVARDPAPGASLASDRGQPKPVPTRSAQPRPAPTAAAANVAALAAATPADLTQAGNRANPAAVARTGDATSLAAPTELPEPADRIVPTGAAEAAAPAGAATPAAAADSTNPAEPAEPAQPAEAAERADSAEAAEAADGRGRRGARR